MTFSLSICALILSCLLMQIAAAAADDSIHIEIKRKRSLQHNGNEIDEHSLLKHLAAHERELIFGKSGAPLTFKLMHLSHRADVANTDADAVAAADDADDGRLKQAWRRRRKRRSAAEPTSTPTPKSVNEQEFVSVQIQDSEHFVELKLQQTPKLIDDAFIYIKRNANNTQFIENSLKLVEQYERCFYRSENSALDLCDETSVRGVYKHNNSDFVIQPLPKRFGNTSHVIFEARQNRRTDDTIDDRLTDTTFDQLNVQFEPDEAAFTEPSIVNLTSSSEEHTTRPTRNIHEHIDDIVHNHTFNGVAHHRHDGGNRKSQKLHLNLRYKPRYQQQPNNDHHKHKHHTHKSTAQRQQHHTHHHHHYKRLHKHLKQEHEQRTTMPGQRVRRHIPSPAHAKTPYELHIETAIFVDSDLYRHMEKNFPKDTESHLIRFVLAMINGVQLLYHHATLGRRINFVLKRLEIFKKDPPELRRSSDIDTYLSNFCLWQKSFNPPSDADSLHYDHAVILTGLDLYVVDKNGKVISQVVGLAPVAGMCTTTSSCTINEGKHFESVFVVAHEIGHNLGMRHDTKENSCDPSLHIMSPTLGSGKITWSKCSRTYLNDFLESEQSHCLFDRGQFKAHLDHSAEGILPGERFDADQQCMLKYGRNSVRAPQQTKVEICRDLHCQRDRYTWTSHPALEGTDCGDNMYCRSGVCIRRPAPPEPTYSAIKQPNSLSKTNYEKSNFVESSKMGQLLQEYNYNKISDHGTPMWSDWGVASACDSGCLYGPSKRLSEGSTGLRSYSRSCLNYRQHCLGRDHKYESCVAKQCFSSAVPMQTIEDFATQVCKKAQNLDTELTGEGQQLVGDLEESCKVFCKTKANGTKSRRWTFPDGTTCRSKHYGPDDIAYCISGRCEKFSCDNSTKNYFKIASTFCQYRTPSLTQASSAEMESKHYNHYYNNNNNRRYNEAHGNYNGGIAGPTTVRSRYENEVALRNFHGQERQSSPYKRKVDSYPSWHKYNYRLNEQQTSVTTAPPPPPASASLVATSGENEWTVWSGCHSSCMAKSKGVQVVRSRLTGANNIQLCTHQVKPCERLLTAAEFAEHTCARYKLKVRGLSGHGTQIAASIDEPDRSCRVGCQDESIKYRYYLVNGKYGHFPLGTKCSNTEERYCVNGKCLEFGENDIPLQQSHISLALFRNKREAPASEQRLSRAKRSFLYYDPINITETITQEFLNNIVNSIIDFEQKHMGDELLTDEHIEFNNPIHMSTDELSTE